MPRTLIQTSPSARLKNDREVRSVLNFARLALAKGKNDLALGLFLSVARADTPTPYRVDRTHCNLYSQSTSDSVRLARYTIAAPARLALACKELAKWKETPYDKKTARKMEKGIRKIAKEMADYGEHGLTGNIYGIAGLNQLPRAIAPPAKATT